MLNQTKIGRNNVAVDSVLNSDANLLLTNREQHFYFSLPLQVEVQEHKCRSYLLTKKHNIPWLQSSKFNIVEGPISSIRIACITNERIPMHIFL